MHMEACNPQQSWRAAFAGVQMGGRVQLWEWGREATVGRGGGRLMSRSLCMRDALAAVSRKQAVRGLAAAMCALGLVAEKTPAADGEAGVPKQKFGARGLELSRLVQGHWQLSWHSDGGSRKTEAILADMQTHRAAGITTFDTADIYGPSEEIIGRYFNEQGGAGAQVCTKFCCFDKLDKIDKKQVAKRIKRSCQKLGVPKIDLIALFWLDFGVQNYVQVAKYLVELQQEGLIGEIGVTNFDVPREFV
jgi:hypothetical protein